MGVVVVIGVLLGTLGSPQAQTPRSGNLRIGAVTEPAVDPHFVFLGSNVAYSRHMFDALVGSDADGKKFPGLALSWTAVDDRTWEFKLRPGVKFHDGSEHTAEDVAFTIKRVPGIPNNPNSYTGNIRTVTSTEIVDPLTIRFRTRVPDPSLPDLLTSIFIVSSRAAANASPADFRSGKAAIGTGPYRMVRFAAADRLVLERNESYWGGRPAWAGVEFRLLSNEAARIAGAAGGGEILASQETVDGTRFATTQPRSIQLKGLREPMDVVSVEWK